MSDRMKQTMARWGLSWPLEFGNHRQIEALRVLEFATTPVEADPRQLELPLECA